MNAFSTDNLIQNLNHDDRIVRSVALDLLASRGERSLSFTGAVLDTFEKRGLRDAFLLEANRFNSSHNESTLERLFCFLETIIPEQSAWETRRMDSLLGWLLEAPTQSVLASAERLEKITGHNPALEASLSILLERMKFREKWADLPAETLRAMLDELLQDAAETMVTLFPDREVVLIHDLCPFLLEKDAVSPEERQAWMQYEFDPEVMDYKTEFQLSTAFELAIAAKEPPEFDLLLRNLALDWDWIVDLVREIFCRVCGPDEVARLFEVYPQVDEILRAKLGDIFDNLEAPSYADAIVATLSKESSGELLLYHARTLASTGSEDGIAAAYDIVVDDENSPDTIEVIQILYTWHILTGQSTPELERWEAFIADDADMHEEMQNMPNEDALLAAFEKQQFMPPLSELGDVPEAFSYDPDSPQPNWNELSDAEKELVVIRYVDANEPDIPGSMEHAQFHILVENQIAMGDETPVAATVERLVGEGLSRHESVHAIASALVEEMMVSRDGDRQRTEQDYFERLGNLTAARWFADFREDEGPPRDSTPPFQRSHARVGRNDPCPCRSGKKYKQCCMKFAN